VAKWRNGAAEQAAEKLDFALAFGWRSGLPLRYNRIVSSAASAAEVTVLDRKGLFRSL
jgi:hypothetical protein